MAHNESRDPKAAFEMDGKVLPLEAVKKVMI